MSFILLNISFINFPDIGAHEPFSIIPTFFNFLSDITKIGFQLSTIGINGDQDGYTIVNFVLMYLIGAYLAKCDLKELKLYKIQVMLLINILIIFALMYNYKDLALAYCNPFVISEAVLFFCLFSKLNIKNSSIINGLAKCSFSVYLLHFYFYSFINIEHFVNLNPIVLVLHITISLCAIYLVCWVFGFVYDKVTNPIYKHISDKYPSLVWNIKT